MTCYIAGQSLNWAEWTLLAIFGLLGLLLAVSLALAIGATIYRWFVPTP